MTSPTPVCQHAGPPSAPAAEPVELTVFAAASVEATLTEIAEGAIKRSSPNVELKSLPLTPPAPSRPRSREGPLCTSFISAAQKRMNQLDSADTTGTNTDGLDFVYSDTRFRSGGNKGEVLAVLDDNPKDIQSFSDLASDKLSAVHWK